GADEPIILSEGNLTKREEIFDEISLDEPKEERLRDEEIINNNFHDPADISHSSKNNECDSIKDLHSDYDKGDDKVEVNENTSILIAHKKMDDFPRIHAPVLTCSAVATHSMSASPAT
uniref:Uncharacterized protein n=1 Tax=Ciona savignyi TaxID=51511 RepID=H2YW85_CIOSA